MIVIVLGVGRKREVLSSGGNRRRLVSLVNKIANNIMNMN